MHIHAPFIASTVVAAMLTATSLAGAAIPAKKTTQQLGVLQQAGVGSEHGYARAGVLELGGFGNVTLAETFTSIGCSPTVGWFIFDNLEISAITTVNFVSQETVVVDANGVTVVDDVDSTVLLLLVEPSYHLKLTPVMYGFLGIGAGLASQEPGAGAGFAVAPRFGLNLLIGRSGIFTPALVAVYQTAEARDTPQGSSGVSGTFGLSAGFTVMW